MTFSSVCLACDLLRERLRADLLLLRDRLELDRRSLLLLLPDPPVTATGGAYDPFASSVPTDLSVLRRMTRFFFFFFTNFMVLPLPPPEPPILRMKKSTYVSLRRLRFLLLQQTLKQTE